MVSTELKRANPNTIQDKVLVGYQGWFTCAGDGPPLDPGHHGWLHWFNFPIPNGGRPNTDIWPDTSDYDPSELYPAPGLATASGDPVHLFSSRHPKTVQRHFHWMARHGVDGAFLQRFAGQCEIKSGNIAIRDLRDEIGDRVREAAEAEGRVFAIMYDVSGVSPDKIQNILEQDWTHLLRDKHILDSPNYLRENGRPVVALWGFGLNGRNHTPELVRAITGFFRSFTPGGVYLVAGTPGHWRTSSSDADRNPEFVQVWTDCFDAISPWTVGRYGNEEEADQWGQGRLKVDAEYLKNMETQGGRKVDYIPVVLPGGSGFNLSEGKWRMNDMRRHGGRFLWRQIYNAKCAGVRTIYGAMWDEYDEGTAFMPVVPHASQLPVHPSFRFLALDVDGHDLPSDWYMRIAGFAAEAFHGERTLPDTLPVKELQDYWSSRPRYEGGGKINDKQAADVDGVTRAVGAWGISEGNVQMNVPTDAPPPYSLEDTPAQQAPPGGVRPPPVRQDTRPSSSQAHSPAMLAAGAAAAAVSAGIAAHALSARSGNTASGGAMPRPTPPPVNMSARPPPPPTRPSCRASSEIGMPIGPPAALGPSSPPGAQVGYDPGRQAYEHGRVPSIGRGGMGFPAPVGPPPMGPPPMGVDYGRGRGRSRSRSKSRSKSRSRSRTRKYKLKDRRSRSRSRSSSGSRRGDRLPVHSVHQSLHRHGQSFGHGHGRGPGVHGHGLVHTQSLPPVGSPHAMAFPGAGAGAGTYDAYAGGGGGYAPVHSHPVGYGGPGASGPGYAPGQGQQGYAPGQGQGQQGYTPGQGQGQQGYAQGQGPVPHAAYGRYASPPPQGGYGPGPGYGQGQGQQGQGYDAMGSPQQPQGYGYTSHPPSGYSSYGGAGPYPGGSGSGGGGGGGIQAGIATALQKVEGIAGPQTRMQLERTVKSLTNTGSSLFNKFK